MQILHFPRSNPGQIGVTLIELLVVLALIAILGGIAYPSYQEHVARANRAEAKGILLEAAQFMERNYTTNNCYHRSDNDCAAARTAGTACASATAGEISLPFCQSPKTGEARYNISFNALASQSYTLQAVPTGIMAGDACGTLTLTHTGIQGAGGNVADCWQR